MERERERVRARKEIDVCVCVRLASWWLADSFMCDRVAAKRCTKDDAAANFVREIEIMKQLGDHGGIRCSKIVRFIGVTLTVRSREEAEMEKRCSSCNAVSGRPPSGDGAGAVLDGGAHVPALQAGLASRDPQLDSPRHLWYGCCLRYMGKRNKDNMLIRVCVQRDWAFLLARRSSIGTLQVSAWSVCACVSTDMFVALVLWRQRGTAL
jgi:hypothetical protein